MNLVIKDYGNATSGFGGTHSTCSRSWLGNGQLVDNEKFAEAGRSENAPIGAATS